MSEEKRCMRCNRVLSEQESKFVIQICNDCYKYERWIFECEWEPEDDYYYEMGEEM